MRVWTEQDREQALELGFELRETLGGYIVMPANPYVLLYSRVYAYMHLVDLAVWTLALADEPTAVKALAIMEGSPTWGRSFKTYLAFTSTGLREEMGAYQKDFNAKEVVVDARMD